MTISRCVIKEIHCKVLFLDPNCLIREIFVKKENELKAK